MREKIKNCVTKERNKGFSNEMQLKTRENNEDKFVRLLSKL